MNGGFTDFSGNKVTEAEAKVHGQIQALYFVKSLVWELPIFAWLAPILLGSCQILQGGNFLPLAADVQFSCSQHSRGYKNGNS